MQIQPNHKKMNVFKCKTYIGSLENSSGILCKEFIFQVVADGLWIYWSDFECI